MSNIITKLSHDIAKMAAAKNIAYATDIPNTFNPSYNIDLTATDTKNISIPKPDFNNTPQPLPTKKPAAKPAAKPAK